MSETVLDSGAKIKLSGEPEKPFLGLSSES